MQTKQCKMLKRSLFVLKFETKAFSFGFFRTPKTTHDTCESRCEAFANAPMGAPPAIDVFDGKILKCQSWNVRKIVKSLRTNCDKSEKSQKFQIQRLWMQYAKTIGISLISVHSELTNAKTVKKCELHKIIKVKKWLVSNSVFFLWRNSPYTTCLDVNCHSFTMLIIFSLGIFRSLFGPFCDKQMCAIRIKCA